jgi:hypothetical protein
LEGEVTLAIQKRYLSKKKKVVGLFTRRFGRILKTYEDMCSPNVGTRLTKRATAVKSFCYKS